MHTPLFSLLLHLADNTLILAQRNSEWTGHGPVLEQDIAITNIALDLLGQTRNLYQYAASVYNGFTEEEKAQAAALIPRPWLDYGRELQEDDLAFLRDEPQYRNVLLTELPRGDWAFTTLRQFFFSAFQFFYYRELQKSKDAQLAGIAEKSQKEVTYHLKWSSEWVIRLGDGTEESNRRMNDALDELWPYTGELFRPAAYEQQAAEQGRGVHVALLKEAWTEKLRTVFSKAGLHLPQKEGMQTGGKEGIHTEHLGYLLTELQYMQRTYPNKVW